MRLKNETIEDDERRREADQEKNDIFPPGFHRRFFLFLGQRQIPPQWMPDAFVGDRLESIHGSFANVTITITRRINGVNVASN